MRNSEDAALRLRVRLLCVLQQVLPTRVQRTFSAERAEKGTLERGAGRAVHVRHGLPLLEEILDDCGAADRKRARE